MIKYVLLLLSFLLFSPTFAQTASINTVADFREISSSTSNTSYYVSTTGNDSADGSTPAKAWKTIDRVNNETFLPGDFILFKRGNTWNEQLVVPSSGEANKYITFGAYGSGNLPVIDGRGLRLARNKGLIHIGLNKSYIIIENLRVINAGIGYPNEIHGINFEQSTYGIIQNCETYNTEASGIITHNSHTVIIDSNEVELACVNSRSESISVSKTTNFEVRNNVVHNNRGIPGSGSGICLKSSHYGRVHHNEVYDMHKTNGIYPGSYTDHTSDIEVYSN
jgi:hypothetical protein